MTARPPAQVPPPYTYEEAQTLFMKAQKLQPMFSLDQFATIAFLLLLIAFTLTGLFSLSKDKSKVSGGLAALVYAVPASVFFGYVCVTVYGG